MHSRISKIALNGYLVEELLTLPLNKIVEVKSGAHNYFWSVRGEVYYPLQAPCCCGSRIACIRIHYNVYKCIQVYGSRALLEPSGMVFRACTCMRASSCPSPPQGEVQNCKNPPQGKVQNCKQPPARGALRAVSRSASDEPSKLTTL